MSKWINAAEAALADIKKVSKTPYDYGKFSSSDNQLPDSYIVYFLVSHPPGLFADNKEVSSEPRIQVSFFFRKKKALLTMMDTIKANFVKKGFVRMGEGNIPFQKDTGHYGWRCDFKLYESR